MALSACQAHVNGLAEMVISQGSSSLSGNVFRTMKILRMKGHCVGTGEMCGGRMSEA